MKNILLIVVLFVSLMFSGIEAHADVVVAVNQVDETGTQKIIAIDLATGRELFSSPIMGIPHAKILKNKKLAVAGISLDPPNNLEIYKYKPDYSAENKVSVAIQNALLPIVPWPPNKMIYIDESGEKLAILGISKKYTPTLEIYSLNSGEKITTLGLKKFSSLHPYIYWMEEGKKILSIDVYDGGVGYIDVATNKTVEKFSVKTDLKEQAVGERGFDSVISSSGIVYILGRNGVLAHTQKEKSPAFRENWTRQKIWEGWREVGEISVSNNGRYLGAPIRIVGKTGDHATSNLIVIDTENIKKTRYLKVSENYQKILVHSSGDVVLASKGKDEFSILNGQTGKKINTHTIKGEFRIIGIVEDDMQKVPEGITQAVQEDTKTGSKRSIQGLVIFIIAIGILLLVVFSLMRKKGR